MLLKKQQTNAHHLTWGSLWPPFVCTLAIALPSDLSLQLCSPVLRPSLPVQGGQEASKSGHPKTLKPALPLAWVYCWCCRLLWKKTHRLTIPWVYHESLWVHGKTPTGRWFWDIYLLFGRCQSITPYHFSSFNGCFLARRRENSESSSPPWPLLWAFRSNPDFWADKKFLRGTD